MFTLPPRPPKDYVIKDVTRSLRSSAQFTPDSLPRVTQQNLAKYCSPVEYRDNEVPKNAIVEIEPSILNKMTNEARALWLPSPEKDAFTIHEVYKKYNIPPQSYDPRFRNGEKVFNRSYKYELDCIEAIRQEKLRTKCLKEQEIFDKNFRDKKIVEAQMNKPPLMLNSCEAEPPFWWRDFSLYAYHDTKLNDDKTKNITNLGDTTYKSSYVRWQEEPNLTGYVQDDPCKRKRDMRLVGQPFRSEACNWYYKTYQPPDIKFRPKKFN